MTPDSSVGHVDCFPATNRFYASIYYSIYYGRGSTNTLMNYFPLIFLSNAVSSYGTNILFFSE